MTNNLTPTAPKKRMSLYMKAVLISTAIEIVPFVCIFAPLAPLVFISNLLYWLPLRLAGNKPQAKQILIILICSATVGLPLTFFVVGGIVLIVAWVFCLVWASQNPTPAGAIPLPQQPQPDAAGQLAKLAELKDKGILSEAEFTAQKAKLLS